MTLLLLPESIERIVQSLCEKRLAVFPTDTVYGIGCLAEDESAVAALYKAKGRDFRAALPVMVASAGQVGQVARPLPALERLAERFWPGPLTIILPKQPWLPLLVTAGGDTVGVRVPDHPLALAILQQVGRPLAVSSANLSGQPPARTVAHALAQLDGRVDVIMDGGEAPGGQASTVLDLTTDPPRILRQGPAPADEIADCLGVALV
jgi:L-threonylcarbamoyladenylate synthase